MTKVQPLTLSQLIKRLQDIQMMEANEDTIVVREYDIEDYIYIDTFPEYDDESNTVQMIIRMPSWQSDPRKK